MGSTYRSTIIVNYLLVPPPFSIVPLSTIAQLLRSFPYLYSFFAFPLRQVELTIRKLAALTERRWEKGKWGRGKGTCITLGPFAVALSQLATFALARSSALPLHSP